MKELHSFRRKTALVVAILLSISLSSCIIIEGPPIDAPERPEPTVSTPDPQFYEDGTAQENLDFFTKVLQDFTESTTEINSNGMVSALAESGFDKSMMQHTQDKTKTNLDAESVSVSVRIDRDCLIGQISRKSKSLFVDLAPAVGSQRDVCLIGGISAD